VSYELLNVVGRCSGELPVAGSDGNGFNLVSHWGERFVTLENRLLKKSMTADGEDAA
jgi:hypothetical protein